MVPSLVLQEKSLVVIGTGNYLNVFQIPSWQLTKKVKIPCENETVFDMKYLKTREAVVVYVRSEEDMANVPKLFFWSVDGLKFVKGPVKWISHNISKNFFVFDGFDFFFSLASQTKVVFQNIRDFRREKDLELPLKSAGCSFYKLVGKDRIICVCRSLTKFYLALIIY